MAGLDLVPRSDLEVAGGVGRGRGSEEAGRGAVRETQRLDQLVCCIGDLCCDGSRGVCKMQMRLLVDFCGC